MSNYLTPEEKQKVYESLEKKEATTKSIKDSVTLKNQNIEERWEEQTYEDHKKRF